MARIEIEKSQVIAAIEYSRAARVLTIEFTSGQTYKYFGVSRYRRDQLLAAESKGRYFVAHIRNAGYTFQKL